MKLVKLEQRFKSLSCVSGVRKCVFKRVHALKMDTPHKDNECEKQIMESVQAVENQKRNLKSEFAAWRRRIKPLYEILGTRPDDEEFGKLVFDDLENVAEESLSVEKIWKCQVKKIAV